MKLAEMSTTSAKKINKVLESRFGFAIDFDTLTVEKATKLAETIDANLNKIRHSVNLHKAETNPRYMELLTVHEGLTNWLKENTDVEFVTEEPETTEEVITEGEVGDAEVLLAAKDMVDSIQDVIEQVGKMQNEQLPQLVDSIRDQIGSEQAEGFDGAVGPTLDTLMDELKMAREGIDNGVKILTGEQVEAPMDLPEPESELDLDEPLDDTDGFNATDAAVGGEEELGREKR